MKTNCEKFLKRNDRLGANVKLNFKGSPQYGTVIGGCFSLLVTAFFVLFIGLQLFAWLFDPEYKQEILVKYHSRNEPVTYEIPLKSFLPSVVVVENFSGLTSQSEWITNDPNKFYIGFVEYKPNNGESKPIDAINCQELINNMPDLIEEER